MKDDGPTEQVLEVAWPFEPLLHEFSHHPRACPKSRHHHCRGALNTESEGPLHGTLAPGAWKARHFARRQKWHTAWPLFRHHGGVGSEQ